MDALSSAVAESLSNERLRLLNAADWDANIEAGRVDGVTVKASVVAARSTVAQETSSDWEDFIVV